MLWPRAGHQVTEGVRRGCHMALYTSLALHGLCTYVCLFLGICGCKLKKRRSGEYTNRQCLPSHRRRKQRQGKGRLNRHCPFTLILLICGKGRAFRGEQRHEQLRDCKNV